EVEHKKLDYRVTPTKSRISSGTTLILGLVGMAIWTGQIVQPVTDHYTLIKKRIRKNAVFLFTG
ncbi:MAG: hypothetical protein AAF639_39200, partial [Chloroflexota bacterium]